MRRKGLGKFMMLVLEMLAFKANMIKIMLTMLRSNHGAQAFFKLCLKFEMDESSPTDNKSDYEILSKLNKRKIAAEGPRPGMMKGGGCCSSC